MCWYVLVCVGMCCMCSAQACIIAPATTCCVASEIGLPRRPATGAAPRPNLVATSSNIKLRGIGDYFQSQGEGGRLSFSDSDGCDFWDLRMEDDGSASHPASTSSPGG